MSTFLGIDARSGCNTDPIGQHAVENLNENATYILLNPFVEKPTKEASPLLGSDRKVGNGRIGSVTNRCQMAAVGMLHVTFHDGSKLDILAPYTFEKAIKSLRMISIIAVDNGHGIPFHTIMLQQLNAFHNLLPRWSALTVAPITVMKSFRTIDRDAYKPIVRLQKTAPFIGKQRAVSLQ